MNLGVVKSRTHLGYSRVEEISVISYQTIYVINRLANLVSSFLDCNQLEMESVLWRERRGGGGGGGGDGEGGEVGGRDIIGECHVVILPRASYFYILSARPSTERSISSTLNVIKINFKATVLRKLLHFCFDFLD